MRQVYAPVAAGGLLTTVPGGEVLDRVAYVPVEALWFLALGTICVLASALILVFRARLAHSIVSALNETPGIPFRGGATRNANPSQLLGASIVSFAIGTVFLVQAGLRLARFSETNPAGSLPVVVVSGLAISLLLAGAVTVAVGLRRAKRKRHTVAEGSHSSESRAPTVVLAVAFIGLAIVDGWILLLMV